MKENRTIRPYELVHRADCRASIDQGSSPRIDPRYLRVKLSYKQSTHMCQMANRGMRMFIKGEYKRTCSWNTSKCAHTHYLITILKCVTQNKKRNTNITPVNEGSSTFRCCKTEIDNFKSACNWYKHIFINWILKFTRFPSQFKPFKPKFVLNYLNI
jgi:hypothetical protein